MHIKKLRLENFRRFSEFEISFDKKMTVLIARNGAGKTSVLDALAMALGPFLTRLPDVSGIAIKKDKDLRVLSDGKQAPYVRITCESYDGIMWDSQEKRDKTVKTSALIPDRLGRRQLNDYVDSLVDLHNEAKDFQLPIFIYYGTGRGVFDFPQRKKGFGKSFSRFAAFDGALESRTNFKRFVEYFYFLEEKENRLHKEQQSFSVQLPELASIRTALSRLMPEFSNPRGVYPAGIMVDWLVDNSSKTLRIEQLSDGYRTTLAMVMDIAARMAEANPELQDPLDTSGVVMIDEVDLHLHPGWQQRILPDLIRTFPKIQFIVTTHSPQVVSTVDSNSLRVINWENEAPVLLPVSFSLGAESQQVLKQVLGVDNRPEDLDIVNKLYRYQKLVFNNEWDCKEALKLRQELDEWGAGNEPELLRLDIDIRLKELDRNNEKS